MIRTKKSLISIIMILMIMFITFSNDYKEAEAAPVVVVGAVTVGALLLCAVALVAASDGIKLNITDTHDFTRFIAQYFEDHAVSSSSLNTWWTRIKQKATSFQIVSLTLFAAILNGVVNLFDFGIKADENFNITIDAETKVILESAIKEYFGYDTLTAGQVDTMSNVLLAEHITNLHNSSLFTMPYITIYKYSMVPYYTHVYVMGSYTKPFIKYNGIQLLLVQPVGSVYSDYQVHPELFTYTYNGDTTLNGTSLFDLYASFPNGTVLPSSAHKLLYNNYDIDCINQTTGSKIFTIGKDGGSYTIPATMYGLTSAPAISIDNNPYLERSLQNIDNWDMVNTDTIVTAIDQADIAAERVGSDVVNIDITDTKVIDNPIDESNEWYDVILNPLKEFARWLFVPSSVKVNEFVTHCEETMDRQAGILTYPLTLVIQFLMAVMTLDVTDCVLHIPRMEVFGYEIYGGLNYNITQELKQSAYSEMYSIYLLITDFIMIIAFLDLAIKKGDEIIRGN